MGAIVIFTGDSHTDGTGAPPGESWPTQMMRMLDRPDVEVVNTAHAGAPLWEQVASWNVTVAPHLARATGVKIVFGMGGYNDSSRDHASLDQIVATYRLESELAHAAGARFVGGLDVIRFDGGDGRQNALIQAVNAALRQADFCDALVDFAAEPMFDRAQGPYSAAGLRGGQGASQRRGAAVDGADGAAGVSDVAGRVGQGFALDRVPSGKREGARRLGASAPRPALILGRSRGAALGGVQG